MTLASLMSRMVEFLSYLYYDRLWATWELLVLAAAAVLLLVAMRQKRKVKPIRITARPVEERPQVIGARLSERKELYSLPENNDGGRIAATAKQKDNGTKLNWRQATQKCRSFRELVEQLQHEVIKYKRAEDSFKQQVVSLTTVNRQLEERLGQRAGRNTEMTGNTARARILS